MKGWIVPCDSFLLKFKSNSNASMQFLISCKETTESSDEELSYSFVLSMNEFFERCKREMKQIHQHHHSEEIGNRNHYVLKC